MADIKRIELPSGGWWKIVVRPRWKHVAQWTDEGTDLVERALASLTIAWSFEDEVSLETLAQRDPGDLVAVLEAFRREVVPYLDEGSPQSMAEELFSGLVAGRIPPQFSEVHLMASTGWSWETLQETPADVVRMMTLYLAVRHVRDSGGTLEYRDAEV